MSLLYTLPHEVHVDILSLLSLKELCKYLRCSKQCKQAGEDDRLWFAKGFIVSVNNNNNGKSYIPSIRLCHSVVIYDNQMFIFGGDSGTDGGSRISEIKGDLFAFSFDNYSWSPVNTSTRSPVLTEHTAVLSRHCLVLFGGNCSDSSNPLCLGDVVHSINLETKQVQKLECSGSIMKRSAHTAVAYNHKMYVFGGWDAQKTFGETLHVLDINKREWDIVPTTGTPPSKRRAHSAVVHDHFMYLFGGYEESAHASSFNKMFRFDFETNEWVIINATGDIPSGRSRADMACYQDCQKIYLVGGWNRREYFAEIYEFNTTTNFWRKLPTNLPSLTKGITQHRMVVHNHWLMIFGGYSDTEKCATNKILAFCLRKNNK